MSVESTIEGNNIGLIDTWRGSITGDDILGLLKSLFSDKAFREYKYWVTDFSDVTDFSMSPDEIQKVVDLDKKAEKVNSDIIIVVIAPKDLYFGLSRMWDSMSHEICWEKMVLRTKVDAYDFLKKRTKEKFNINISNVLT